MPLSQKDFIVLVQDHPGRVAENIGRLVMIFGKNLTLTTPQERFNYIFYMANSAEFKTEDLVPIVRELPGRKFLKEWLISGRSVEEQMEDFLPGRNDD